ncbi:RNA polymerase factor sigma-54 [Opitutales bacterium ASA1]|uniref:RNA polymerase factor sigma-54 n=1 Tax=Congregicoccus parvus TaxID=3081749 RepID=UPI002B3151D8|nr:RNA polymerase factor sigma-54 [Opitutales bacterium ASA1]
MSGFSQELRQRQTQQLVLAPQLRQSLKILQVAALDLRTTIQEELQNNPTLEELPMEGVAAERPDPDSREHDENSGDRAESTADSREELQFERNFEILNRLDQDWRDHMSQSSGSGSFTQEDAERRQHFFDSLVGETSLQEHLLDQARLADLDEKEMEAISYLIGSLDNNGFLTTTLNDVALMADIPLSIVQRAHTVLKGFEPAGIGCLNLQDSLLHQLIIRGKARSIPARIVKDHFLLLTRRRIPEIARKMNLPLEEIQRAIEEIAQLDPAPGRRFGEDSNRVVVPDVVIEEIAGEWVISLTSDYIPRLRLSSSYKELLAKGTLSREEKEYLQEKMRSGRFLINSIEQRQQTIEKIAREILNRQREFFEEGVSKLKPLTMTQVAEVVGVHETTVSRAIANKYMRTPHGVFEMRYFFTSGYQSSEGESISNTSVKDMIAQLIAAEDPEKPMSDQEIVGKLAERSINIARRTVAKYREELGILPSNLRREYS